MSTLPQTPAKKAAAKNVATPPAARKALAKAVPPPKPVAKAPAQPQVKAAPLAPALEVPVKPKKPKMVRDSFTIPKNEYEAIASLKERALKQGMSIKKSELLRAGLMTRHYAGYATNHKNRGGGRHVVYVVKPAVLRLLRRPAAAQGGALAQVPRQGELFAA